MGEQLPADGDAAAVRAVLRAARVCGLESTRARAWPTVRRGRRAQLYHRPIGEEHVLVEHAQCELHVGLEPHEAVEVLLPPHLERAVGPGAQHVGPPLPVLAAADARLPLEVGARALDGEDAVPARRAREWLASEATRVGSE